jgi:ABC-type nitrate/sulfonate/bicarbonate transport system substrate-binding protein
MIALEELMKIYAAILAALLTCTVGLISPAISAEKLSVGVVSLVANTWPYFVAEKQGFFKEEGVDPDSIIVGGVVASAQQVIGGSLDFGFTTMEVAIRAIDKNADIKIVGSGLIKYPYSLVGLREIKGAQDLVGKSVMLPVPHNDVANFFEAWVRSSAVDPDKIDKVYDGSSANRYAALKSGAVVAVTITQPFDFIAEDDGYVRIVDFALLEHYAFEAVIARPEWLAEHSAAARAYLKALARGVDWLYDPANRDAAIDILAQATKTKPEVAARTYNYFFNEIKPFSRNLDVPDEDIGNVVKTLAESGDIKPTTDIHKFVDLQYLPH